MLGDRCARKNSRQYNSIYNVYWLLSQFKFVQSLTQLLPSNLEVALYLRAKLTCTAQKHRCIFTEVEYIEFYITLDGGITIPPCTGGLFRGQIVLTPGILSDLSLLCANIDVYLQRLNT